MPDSIAVRTNLAGHVTVQAREHNVAVEKVFGLALFDDKIAELAGHGNALLPSDSVSILFACRPRGRANGMELKEWMRGQQYDKTLADAAGCTQYSY